jgi:REP element-mobilizing transposase RayT
MKFRRKSLRLTNFDYSQTGLFYITICVNQQLCLFGDVVDKKLQINDAGKMIAHSFIEITKHYHGFDIDTYIVMPNHFHGILIINKQPVGAPPRGHPFLKQRLFDQNTLTLNELSLGDVVGRFKSITTHRYIMGVKKNQWKPFYEKLWQRNYYDRIIKNKKTLYATRKYIIDNPLHWKINI